jgi:hypothetical protein
MYFILIIFKDNKRTGFVEIRVDDDVCFYQELSLDQGNWHQGTL